MLPFSRPPGEWRNLADAQASGACELRLVGVQVPPRPPVYASSSVRRRRRRWWLAVIPAVVILAIVGAVSLQNDTRELVGFFDRARRVADSQEARAVVFQDLVRRELDEVSRDRFMALINELTQGVGDASGVLSSGDPPAEAAGANEVLVLALDSWGQGLSLFGAALMGVVDEPLSPVAEQDLEVALTHMRVGDAAYARFLSRSDALRDGLDVSIGPLPSVAYLGGEPPIVSGRLAESARLSAGLALVVDVGISAIRFTPEEISDAGAEVRVIPATQTIDVQIMVANNGNRMEESVRVSAQLITDAGELLFEAERVIEELMPGSQQPAEFFGLRVSPSEAYDLLVVITPVPDERTANLENNLHERRFLINDTVEA